MLCQWIVLFPVSVLLFRCGLSFSCVMVSLRRLASKSVAFSTTVHLSLSTGKMEISPSFRREARALLCWLVMMEAGALVLAREAEFSLISSASGSLFFLMAVSVAVIRSATGVTAKSRPLATCPPQFATVSSLSDRFFTHFSRNESHDNMSCFPVLACGLRNLHVSP